jgi:hypothetical protein
MRWHLCIGWSWGSQHRFAEREQRGLTADSVEAATTEADRIVRDFIAGRRFAMAAFDCGRTTHPLLPCLTFVELTPVGETISLPTKPYDEAETAAIAAARVAIERRRAEVAS